MDKRVKNVLKCLNNRESGAWGNLSATESNGTFVREGGGEGDKILEEGTNWGEK